MKRSFIHDMEKSLEEFNDANRESFTLTDAIVFGIVVPIVFVIASGFFPWLFAKICQC